MHASVSLPPPIPLATKGVSARRAVSAAVLLALALRLAAVGFLYPDQLKPAKDHWSFGYEGGRIARAIVTGRGFSDPIFAGTGPTAMMPPVHTYIIAGVFKAFGVYSTTSALVLLALNALCSALTCIPIFFIARKTFGLRTAAVATFVWALYPYAILISSEMIWSTCLATLMLTTLVWWTLSLESAPLAGWMAFGALAGVAILTNPAVLPVIPFLLAYGCYRRWLRGHQWLIAAVAACAVIAVAMLPWQVRNYRVFGRFIPLRDNFWSQVWVGNNGDTSLSMEHIAYPSGSETEAGEFRRLGEIKYMEAKRRQAIDFITTHPAWVARQTARRVLYTWTGIWSAPHWPLREPFDPDEEFDPGHVVLCTGLTVLAALGLRQAFRNRNQVRWLFLAALAALPAVYYVTQSYMRYRHPVDPLVVILAAFVLAGEQSGADMVWERERARPRELVRHLTA